MKRNISLVSSVPLLIDLFFDISVGIIDKKSEMFTWQLGQRHLRHLREASVA